MAQNNTNKTLPTKGARRKWDLIKDIKPVRLEASIVVGRLVELNNTPKSTKLLVP